MKRYTWILVFLLGIGQLIAQDCNKSITGYVIDFHDGEALKGAIIRFNDRSIQTDETGQYTIEGLCEVSYAFTVSHEKCETKVVTLDVSEIASHTFYLEHHLNELDEVEITGEKKKTNSSQEETLGSSVLEENSSGALGDALRKITGVSSLNTGSTIVKPVIQGLNGSRVLLMNNGVRMQDMEWGDEHAPNVDVNTAGKITVVKGASALQYGGDAIGGVIIVEPEKVASKDTLYGKTIVTGATNGRGGSLSTKMIKGYESGFFIKAQGTLKRFGDVEAPDYILSNTGVFEKGGSLSIGMNKFSYGWDAFYSFYNNEIGVLASSHIGNVDDLIDAINSREPSIIRDFTYDIKNPKQDVTHHLGRLRFFKRYEELGKWTMQYDFQKNHRMEFDIRRSDDLDEIPSIDLELTTHTITSDFKYDAKYDYSWNAGVLLRYQENFADPSTQVRRLIPDYEKYDAGIFFTGEYDISSEAIIDAGVRYDFNRIDAKKFYLKSRWEERGYDRDFSDIVLEDFGTQILTNPVFDYHSISATVGVQYTYKDAYELRFNYALGQRAPNPSELFSDGLHHSAARIELGDLRMDQEMAHKFSLSIERDYKNWGWEIAPYANYINNYILLEPEGVELTIRGAFPVWGYRQADARLLGVDAKMYANWHQNWQTTHNFSLVKGKETKNDVPLINMPVPNINNAIIYQNKKWKGFKASLESQYFFEQNEYPANIEVYSLRQNENVELEINTPPPAYHLLQADMEMEFPLGEHNLLKMGLTVNNVLNTNYRNYMNRQRYFSDDLGRNFLLRLIINY
ncbi:TonB-dependent receptor [Aquimarina hainanensis]|uniref:TonB-dependent receptor n=1 Tax=Aquimarina hainanensis TaxID=1578017 RepID=A0ABW5N0Z1_9FLAO